VEVEDVGGFAVEDKADGPVTLLPLFPKFARDVVAVAELVGETLAL